MLLRDRLQGQLTSAGSGAQGAPGASTWGGLEHCSALQTSPPHLHLHVLSRGSFVCFRQEISQFSLGREKLLSPSSFGRGWSLRIHMVPGEHRSSGTLAPLRTCCLRLMCECPLVGTEQEHGHSSGSLPLLPLPPGSARNLSWEQQLMSPVQPGRSHFILITSCS